MRVAKRTAIAVFITVAGVLVGAVPASAQDPEKVWESYRAAGGDAIANPTRTREWIAKLQVAADGLTGTWNARARVLEEVGALQGFIGDAEGASRTYELVYEEALERQDVNAAGMALQNLVAYLKKSDTPQAMARSDALYQEYKKTIPNLSVTDEQKQSYLSMAYLEHGQYIVAGITSCKDLAEQQKEAYLLRAIGSMAVAEKIGQTDNFRSSALLGIGKAYVLLGRGAEAAVAFEKIVSLESPCIPPSQARLEAIQARHAKREDWIPEMEKSLSELPPDDFTDAFKQQLVFALFDAKDWIRAAEVAAQIVNVDSHAQAYNHYLLAVALRLAGKHEEAREVIATIKQRFPNSTTAEQLVPTEERLLKSEMASLLKHTERISVETISQSENMSPQALVNGHGREAAQSASAAEPQGEDQGPHTAGTTSSTTWPWIVAAFVAVGIGVSVLVVLRQRGQKGKG